MTQQEALKVYNDCMTANSGSLVLAGGDAFCITEAKKVYPQFVSPSMMAAQTQQQQQPSSDKKGFSIWFWLFLLLILALMVYFFFFNK